MQEPTSGQPKTDGRLAHYDARDVAAVIGARTRMRISSKAVGDMTPKELAGNALKTRSPRHRLACVAELLNRLAPLDVRSMLQGLPKIPREKKSDV